MLLWVIVSAFVAVAAGESVEIVTPVAVPEIEATEPVAMDSYLQALKDTQSGSGGGGGGGSIAVASVPAMTTTAAAANRYDQPGPVAEPPAGYLPSKPSYHQTYQPYGPPTVAPAPSPVQPFYGIPFASPASLLSSFMPKGIDLETVFKIILKLTLFKILVKFFAVICLLLAYPLFQSKDKNDDDNMEEEDNKRQFDTLNNLTAFVWDAIDPANYTESPQLIERIVSDIDTNMTQPSETAAIGFLEFCVNLANMTINWMTSTLRRRRNGPHSDPVRQFFSTLWSRLLKKWFSNNHFASYY